MKKQNANALRCGKGFTLIELLVVVLIIGILAAVALPQYELTVLKSRMAEAVIMTRNIKEASQRHYMATGQYATKFEDLDITVPCKSVSEQGGRCVLEHMVCYTTDSANADGTWIPTAYCNLRHVIYMDSPLRTNRLCLAAASNTLAQRVCKSMGGTETSSAPSSGNIVYLLP